jgi:uncharacterized membrane protein
MTLAVSVVFFGITRRFFHSFLDRGYAFSRTIGILLLSYGVFVLGTFRILPFSELTLAILLIAAFALGSRFSRHHVGQTPLALIIGEEILFIVALFFWTFVRGQEPSIHGLEKFMDFGFIQSILRTKYFPALDMWYASLPINYYYFGHLSGAVQIKLSGISATQGYNLILATIFAQSTVSTFSLVASIVHSFSTRTRMSLVFGAVGTWILNFGGNLHTIYLFTTGYENEKPIPFWEILSGYNPAKYWYPNATRFIPFTIHEFPSYSYVVADLHGHVFDILFVLLTLAVLFLLFTQKPTSMWHRSLFTAFLGFMTAIHYMTNAFDGPIYLLFTLAVFVVLYGFTPSAAVQGLLLALSFFFFSLPFSMHFKPFASGVGINCAPSFLTSMGKFGPFLFEKGNCQPDELWMLFVLWGFFFISFLLFIWSKASEKYREHRTDDYIFMLFAFGIFLVLIPEFFYVKDIYPAHFRANTMFKMGYQAFMMMSIASAYTLFTISRHVERFTVVRKIIWFIPFLFVGVYLFYAAPSYYGTLKRTPQLDGALWMQNEHADSSEIIQFIQQNITGQPVILEAQGDSYTDFNHISAFTGLPTVAGWWVHEWLWRGDSNVVGSRIPDIQTIYQSSDSARVRSLLKKYNVSYVVVSSLERQKYTELQDAKFEKIGKKIFESSNGFGALYQIK